MNQEIKELYKGHWESFENNIWLNSNINSALPYLIYVPEDYESAKFRVMFCGQETQGWGGEFYGMTHVDIDQLRGIYNGFVNMRQGYNSPFWNFQRRITKQFPSVGFIRNNIVKIGKKYDPGCDEVIYDLTKQYFNVFKEELRILRPDLILFLSGSNTYDNKLRDLLGNFTISSLSNKIKFERLIFEDSSLPNCIRINHPRVIQQERKYWIAIDEIQRFLKQFLLEV